MAYQALYRKYRPDSFQTVIGQPHIVRTLTNQVTNGRVSHAYLFCGTRGTGKTSTAKIFAKAINCEGLINGEPCGECKACRAIQEGHSVNVIEIDAASNNGVDNIREIREEVKYPPTVGRYKVYIIDEVHMLSAGAFNALLKTLEEPPAHVIFILATTDPQKVPATILSRCQRYDFRRISAAEITKTLFSYLQEEGVQAEEKAVSYVARLADGSMRDALSILDQCIAFYYGESVTLEKVLEVVGQADDTVFFSMAEAVANQDALRAMQLVDALIMEGRELTQFVTQMVVHFRNVLLVQSVAEPSQVMDLSLETISALETQAKILSPQECTFYIHAFSNLLTEMKYASNSRILLEVLLLKLCSAHTEESVEGIAARLALLERGIKQGAFPAGKAQTGQQEKKKAPPKPIEIPAATSEDQKQAIAIWPELVAEYSGFMHGYLAKTELAAMEEQDILYILCESDGNVGVVEMHLQEITEKLQDKIEKTIVLRVTTRRKYDQWAALKYGETEPAEDAAEFDSKIRETLPDADFY